MTNNYVYCTFRVLNDLHAAAVNISFGGNWTQKLRGVVHSLATGNYILHCEAPCWKSCSEGNVRAASLSHPQPKKLAAVQLGEGALLKKTPLIIIKKTMVRNEVYSEQTPLDRTFLLLRFGVTELESRDETADKAARQLCLIGLHIGGRPSITLQSGSYWAHSTRAPSSHSNISSVRLHRDTSYCCPEAAVSLWMGCYCGSEILRGQNLLPELSNYTSSSVSQWSLLITSKHMAATALSCSMASFIQSPSPRFFLQRWWSFCFRPPRRRLWVRARSQTAPPFHAKRT